MRLLLAVLHDDSIALSKFDFLFEVGIQTVEVKVISTTDAKNVLSATDTQSQPGSL
jgi:hypothetical protein